VKSHGRELRHSRGDLRQRKSSMQAEIENPDSNMVNPNEVRKCGKGGERKNPLLVAVGPGWCNGTLSPRPNSPSECRIKGKSWEGLVVAQDLLIYYPGKALKNPQKRMQSSVYASRAAD